MSERVEAPGMDLAARRRVIARAVPHSRQALLGIVFGILADASVVGLLALSMWLIVRSGEQPPILHLTFAIVGVRALAIGRAAFRYVERISGHNAALAQLGTLRSETFRALIPRVPGAIETHRRGEVLSAFVNDVDQLQDYPLRVRQPLIVSGVVVLLTLLAVLLVSPLAAAILALALALSGACAVWVSARIAGRSDRELSAARASLVDALLERFQAAEVLTAYGALDAHRDTLDRAERRLERVQLERTRAAGLTGALLSVASGAATLLIMLALMPILGEGVTAPVFAAAVIVPAAVFEVFAQVPAAFIARRTVHASAERVAALTEPALPPEIPVDPDPAEHAPAAHEPTIEPVPGEPILSVRDLEVSHPGSADPVVHGITFDIRPGELLVITGESGAGKSTLATALVRLLDYRGSYRVGGVEARTVPAERVRSVVGLCEQTPHLFNADLRQNLKFARDTADDDELMSALERVGLAEWARERGGLDAALGEHGALVSGGQAGRIALARVLLADFPVVILDEPTAGVDRAFADQLLTDLLGAIPPDRAVILITHTDLPPGIRARTLAL